MQFQNINVKNLERTIHSKEINNMKMKLEILSANLLPH